MTLSESELAYRDCFEVLDNAMEHKLGIRKEFPSTESAKYFQMRCNQARKLNRRKTSRIYSDPNDPRHGTSIYDELRITVEWDEDKVYLYLRKLIEPAGKVESLDDLEEPMAALPSPRPQLQLPAPTISRDHDLDPEPRSEPIITRRL